MKTKVARGREYFFSIYLREIVRFAGFLIKKFDGQNIDCISNQGFRGLVNSRNSVQLIWSKSRCAGSSEIIIIKFALFSNYTSKRYSSYSIIYSISIQINFYFVSEAPKFKNLLFF